MYPVNIGAGIRGKNEQIRHQGAVELAFFEGGSKLWPGKTPFSRGQMEVPPSVDVFNVGVGQPIRRGGECPSGKDSLKKGVSEIEVDPGFRTEHPGKGKKIFHAVQNGSGLGFPGGLHTGRQIVHDPTALLQKNTGSDPVCQGRTENRDLRPEFMGLLHGPGYSSSSCGRIVPFSMVAHRGEPEPRKTAPVGLGAGVFHAELDQGEPGPGDEIQGFFDFQAPQSRSSEAQPFPKNHGDIPPPVFRAPVGQPAAQAGAGHETHRAVNRGR